MIYTMPPQMDTGNTTANTQFQIMHVMPETETQAAQTVQAMFPGQSMTGAFKDGEGRIFKVHIQDAEGHMKTVRFSHVQHALETDDVEGDDDGCE